MFYFLPLLIVIVRLNRSTANDSGFLEKRRYIITENGLISKGLIAETLRSWVSMKFAASNKAGIYIELVDRKILMVSRSNFETDAEAIHFLGLLQLNISKAKGYPDLIINNSGQLTNKNKPPYSLGWLGLVPLVGAFVGLALILYGLMQYKDKKLIIIGVAGVVFTVILYGSLFLFTKSKTLRSQFATMDNILLNNLVKDVELYKIQKGDYPDSLEQLRENGAIVNFYDPLISDEKNNEFNYRRVGEKYLLYSSGMDEIPNTDDDIFPTVKIDSNKRGLMLRKQSYR